MEAKVWFISGASRGFGRVWAEAALKRGDKVAATARNTSDLTELVDAFGDSVLPIQLNVNDRQADFEAIQKTQATFGRLDVVVSNAGFGHFGYLEEISEEEARNQIETNLFGSLWVIQAALPIMRAQGSGHIIQVSSIGGVVAFPSLSIYHASKWAVEGICESLAQEVAGFGIKVTLIEPGGYSTDWGGSSAQRSVPIAAYDGLRDRMARSYNQSSIGKPEATGEALLTVVDAEKAPLRLFLGSMPIQIVEPTYQQRLTTWKEWNDVSQAAQG